MFYRGVVEDNLDPLKIGRCRVRILGIHTIENQQSTTEGIPSDHLPWAEPAAPLPGAISGEGESLKIPNLGSWVWCFFEDGTERQRPVYFAVCVGVNETKDKSGRGFVDPTGELPFDDRMGESDLHRYARGETSDEHDEKVNNRKTGVSANGNSWDEPAPPFAADYTKNWVLFFRGNMIEVDETEGAERLHLHHKSGSFDEWHPNGDHVRKIRGTRFVIAEKDENIIVMGARNITVIKNSHEEVNGNRNHKIDGTDTQESGTLNTKTGSHTEDCDSLTINVDGACKVVASSVLIDSSSIDLGKGGKGVVTGGHICHYTRKPHGFFSATVRATP